MSRTVFTVPPKGVGRKDYSQSIELTVEPTIRSHQERFIWIAELIDEPTKTYPDSNLALIYFRDLNGNLLEYVPDDVKYLLYDIVTTGDYHSLIMTSLEKLTYPGEVYIESVGEVHGYGKAELHLSNGHLCEPGVMYGVNITQWSEKANYNAYIKTHGVSDVIIG